MVAGEVVHDAHQLAYLLVGHGIAIGLQDVRVAGRLAMVRSRVEKPDMVTS